MEISTKTLEAFRQWMIARGRTAETAELYASNLRMCAAGSSITARLVSGELAPLTRRTNKAALKAWAKYTKDKDLAEILDEIKLPPARRVGVKIPLPVVDWQRYVKALATCKAEPRVRCVCLVIAKRGLRVSDALRIKRTEVTAALRTGVLSYVGKGSKRHEVSAKPIRAQLEELASHKKWERLEDVVAVRGGRRAASQRVRRAFRSVAKSLGIDGVHPHRFRRTYATNYLDEHRGDPQALIKLQHHMGWASLQTAAMYADAVDRVELDAAGDKMADRIFADD